MTSTKRICCFFGHRKLYDDKETLYKLLLEQIEKLIVDRGFNEFLLGRYGEFDALAHQAVGALKAIYPHIKTVYVQAYYIPHDPNMEYIKNWYDEVQYPEIEEKPKRFAITYRNHAMIDNSDFCIFYVVFSYGGAFDAMKYAKRKGKTMLNIASMRPS